MSLYLDSAYVAKCYLAEPDAARVRRLVEGRSGLHSSAWALAELAAIFHRHVRESRLTRDDALRLHGLFLGDVVEKLWILWPVSDALLRRVGVMIQNVPARIFLRAGDAVHLLSAQEAGFSEIWTNDRHLLQAAPHFSLRGRTV